MKALTLGTYMKIRGINSTKLAKEIGTSRQNIDNWQADGAVVELSDDDLSASSIKNIKITRKVFPKVLHETQVHK